MAVVASKPSPGSVAIDEAPPPSAGHSEDGAALIPVCLLPECQNPPLIKGKIKMLTVIKLLVLTPCFSGSRNFSTYGQKW